MCDSCKCEKYKHKKYELDTNLKAVALCGLIAIGFMLTTAFCIWVDAVIK